jgi:hypothetical protein
MLSRRTMLLGGALTLAPSQLAIAQSPEDDPFPALPSEIAALEARPDFLPSPVLGMQQPPQIDIDTANALLERAPYNCAPIEVAQYFRNIGQGIIPDLGAPELQERVGPHFVRGWPTNYNPVIIEFFNATRTNPLHLSGDGTHWCAAFVNWCIARGRAQDGRVRRYTSAELSHGTRSASSGSFRCWANETSTPERGDVIVWAVEGSVNGCSLGSGHVAFYWGPGEGDRWLALGGNQRNPTTLAGATQSAVCRKSIPRSYAAGDAVKTFHSFRSADFLRTSSEG